MKNKELALILKKFQDGEIDINNATVQIEILYERIKSKEKWASEKQALFSDDTPENHLNAFNDFSRFEFYHYLNEYKDFNYSYDELKNGMEKAKCRNTGWPIGVVFTTEKELLPINVGTDTASIYPPSANYETVFNDFDIWFLSPDLNFYFTRSIDEESHRNKNKNVFFFDVHIWRIAEIFLHTANLYEAFDIPKEENFTLTILYKKMLNRRFDAAESSRFITQEDCVADEFRWSDVLTISTIREQHFELTAFVCSRLFNLFKKTISTEVIREIFNEFIVSKI